MVALAVSFFMLVMLSESWIASTIGFVPACSYFMYKTGSDLVGDEWVELIVRCIFCSLIYAIIGYRTETLTKQSFMGRESDDKAFHRWMKIFETFPEGIALVRSNFVLYANRSLKNILTIGLERSVKDDPIYELFKGDLKVT